MVYVDTQPALATPEASKLRSLTYTLRYDDLLAEQDASFIILNGVSTLKVGRGKAGAGHALRLRDLLLIDDPLVSSHHAEIVAHQQEDVLTDRMSRNGTYVNGVRVQEHVLTDGDLIEMGRSLLTYRRIDPKLAPSLSEAAPPQFFGPTRTHNPEMLGLLRNIRSMAATKESVLILGETGTGKEIVASVVHALSNRTGEFRVVDCGAIPENLFESEMFGHRRGAFTGATEAHIGEIARAHSGTLFLDEVANMSMSAQAKLLRVLEDGRLAAVGSARRESIDVRWIAATNVELFNCDSFRSDVLARLASFVARLPPLRERREDLGILTAHLLRQAGVKKACMTLAAGRQFFSGSFPGNIRQLRNELRTAATLAGEHDIDLEHLRSVEVASRETPRPERAEPPIPQGRPRPSAPAGNRAQTPEAEVVMKALRSTRGNVVQAAQVLKTHPRQLYRWIDRMNISLEQYRSAKG